MEPRSMSAAREGSNSRPSLKSNGQVIALSPDVIAPFSLVRRLCYFMNMSLGGVGPPLYLRCACPPRLLPGRRTEPLIPGVASLEPQCLLSGRRGKRRARHRRVIKAAPRRKRTGISWRDPPERLCRWKTVHERHDGWHAGLRGEQPRPLPPRPGAAARQRRRRAVRRRVGRCDSETALPWGVHTLYVASADAPGHASRPSPVRSASRSGYRPPPPLSPSAPGSGTRPGRG
ncbi:transposase [Streptomyces sp. NPDC056660]|uniref:transposase n=1 Tax=Streptomyces sp. NPDC056660 TaxID=3345897 RepID=UPI0036C0C37F